MKKLLPWAAAATIFGVLTLVALQRFPLDKGTQRETSARPNILLILADDLGVNDIGALGDGIASTPNLDALARAGVRFNRHYANATCRPSRQALLTGREASRIGVVPHVRGISPEVVTLPEALQQAGYQTSHIGKWHLGHQTSLAHPDQQGFQAWFGFLRAELLGSGAMERPRETYNDPWLQSEDAAPSPHSGHLTDILTDAAIREIERLTAAPEPWFINLWFFAPHRPIEPHDRFAGRFPDTDEGRYLALVAQLDEAVGRVLRHLDERGVLADTLVVFSSDNGATNAQRDSNRPYYGNKNTFWEGGVRTPLIFHRPGHLPSGDVDDAVFIREIMPTLLEYAGAAVPGGVTGRSLMPLLRGQPLAEPPVQFWDFHAFTVRKFGLLDLAGGELVYRKTRQRWQPDRQRFGNPVDLDVKGAEAAHSTYLQWAETVRNVPLSVSDNGDERLWSGDSFRRTPGYGGWSLQLPIGPGRDWSARQPGQFSLVARGEELEVSLPGHQFSTTIEDGDCRLLTLSTYYRWRERDGQISEGHVALYEDEELLYSRRFDVAENVLNDRFEPLALRGNNAAPAIHNDVLSANLLARYRTAVADQENTQLPSALSCDFR